MGYTSEFHPTINHHSIYVQQKIAILFGKKKNEEMKELKGAQQIQHRIPPANTTIKFVTQFLQEIHSVILPNFPFSISNFLEKHILFIYCLKIFVMEHQKV